MPNGALTSPGTSRACSVPSLVSLAWHDDVRLSTTMSDILVRVNGLNASMAMARRIARTSRTTLTRGPMRKLSTRKLSTVVGTLAAGVICIGWQPIHAAGLADIDTVVVIYLENWSFDGLFARFPGANGISKATP